ncbi:endolytic transglycosylase MltG [Nonomuraea sp. NPDC000554]|uniref:endolytic transglycosylase MltG n=1 Tax=Nonomuraea sp. NPDC000554 TaxID=3154259 RepID=UPI0033307BD5
MSGTPDDDLIPFAPDPQQPAEQGDPAADGGESASVQEGRSGAGGPPATAEPGSGPELGRSGASGSPATAEPDSGPEPGRTGPDRPQATAEPGSEATSGSPAPDSAPETGDAAASESHQDRQGAKESSEDGDGRAGSVRRAGLFVAGMTAAAVVFGAGGYALLKPLLTPDDFEGSGTGMVIVRIAPGSNAGDVGSALADAGVVASARSFVNATEERAVANKLRPGHYRLRKGMAAGAALDMLLAPSSRLVKRVTLPDGMWLSEALARISKQSGLPLEALQAVDPALVGLPRYAHGLEGFLYPATYEVEPDDKAVDLLASMVERFGAAARKLHLEERSKELHLTPLEAVTVASMVQAEAGQDDDYPKIARVIYNRLQHGMPLQIDSTVLYAQGKRHLKVSERDTRIASPYNTYTRKGLPPGPISNPGEKALTAALHPAQGDWRWFVTTDPAHRITKFTNKESEFVRYREELNRNLGTK